MLAATDEASGAPLAVKLAAAGADAQALLDEFDALRALDGASGIPRAYHCGDQADASAAPEGGDGKGGGAVMLFEARRPWLAPTHVSNFSK